MLFLESALVTDGGVAESDKNFATVLSLDRFTPDEEPNEELNDGKAELRPAKDRTEGSKEDLKDLNEGNETMPMVDAGNANGIGNLDKMEANIEVTELLAYMIIAKS